MKWIMLVVGLIGGCFCAKIINFNFIGDWIKKLLFRDNGSAVGRDRTIDNAIATDINRTEQRFRELNERVKRIEDFVAGAKQHNTDAQAELQNISGLLRQVREQNSGTTKTDKQ